jgi:hypothetical protein
MKKLGDWNSKGATLSQVTAQKEYGVDKDFVVSGIQSGKLEFREGAIWGERYQRVLRCQLEKYIAEELGSDYLKRTKSKTQLRKINKEIDDLKNKLTSLKAKKAEIEKLRSA